jgi:2-polyprenyl-3-methyl-5-hydroxy-6-metoxy-1,4-benzoquinol methylase
MNKLSNQQLVQESKYEHPYHYIPVWNGDNFSQTQTLTWGYEYLSYIYFVIKKSKEIGFQSLLDVGCGDGRFLFEIGHQSSGKRLVGIDYSKRAIDYAKIISPNIEWNCGDIRDNQILDTEFDIITLIETLEHIPLEEISDFLRGIHHFLKETGNIIITVPSKNIPINKKHYQHFDLYSLKETINPFFDAVEVYYLNNNFAISSKLIHKFLSNRFFILNHKKLLKWIYMFYLKNLLISNKDNCSRIALVCKKHIS